MRILLFTTAALALVGASPALAAGKVSFNLSSSLGKQCSIATANTDLTVGPSAAVKADGAFDTNCNFEVADLTLTFTSANGGLYNAVENVSVPYTVTVGAESIPSGSAKAGVPLVAASGPVAGGAISHAFSVSLDSDITVAGDYADVLSVDVAP